VWAEVARPRATRVAITDGLVEVIGVSCKLFLSDNKSVGWVFSWSVAAKCIAFAAGTVHSTQ